ncbi:AEC family transporter [Curvibacter sp. APW13]|uniref:AEC family transporter n=1 Tax=Curvibacter sp. APW13 TaxID=3077236 RepID=UPI0028DF6E7B|nr:AEC family transporter [Curvibacter sp. APW13]MDT8991533.1 AEC family transporter [Curvibacter sp. APW13]
MNYVQLLFPDFSLILCGFLLCRFTPLNRSVWEPVEQLVYFVFFPVLLFYSIIRTPLDLHAASRLLGAGAAMAAVGIALAYALPHIPVLRRYMPIRLHAAAAQVAFRFNSFIALALAERAAGPAGVQLLAVLIGFCVPLYNVAAVWPMARHSEKSMLGELARNPLIIATILGLCGGLLGLAIPKWLEPTVSRIGGASLALGLMAAGAGLRLGALGQAKVLAGAVLTIRHLLLPLVATALAWALHLNTVETTVLLAFSAIPTASSSYVLATRMGYDGAFVAGLVTLSTILGVLSIPFALGVLGGFA